MKLIPISSSASPNMVIFYQKAGFLRYCNAPGFKSICTIINHELAPERFYYDDKMPQCILTFKNDAHVYLLLKRKTNSTKEYIFGSAQVSHVDFYSKVLLIAQLASKHIGCPFYLEDTTAFSSEVYSDN